MIRRTANAVGLAIAVAADRSQVSVHPRADGSVKPGPAVFGAENDVEDDLAEGLRHKEF